MAKKPQVQPVEIVDKNATDPLYSMLGPTGKIEWTGIEQQLNDRRIFKPEDRYLLFSFCATLEEIEKYSKQIPALETDLNKIRDGADLKDPNVRNEIKFYRDTLNFAIDKKSDALSKLIQISSKLGLNPNDRRKMKVVEKEDRDGFEDFLTK